MKFLVVSRRQTAPSRPAPMQRPPQEEEGRGEKRPSTHEHVLGSPTWLRVVIVEAEGREGRRRRSTRGLKEGGRGEASREMFAVGRCRGCSPTRARLSTCRGGDT